MVVVMGCTAHRCVVVHGSLTYHWQPKLQSDELQKLETVHVCMPLASVLKQMYLNNVFKHYQTRQQCWLS
jgi:hypothetical protein